MEMLEITRLSSRGQVVIPQKIREDMKLSTGEKFIVFHEGDTIIFKMLEMPSFDNFDKLIAKSRHFAKRKNLKKADVSDTIKRVRNTHKSK